MGLRLSAATWAESTTVVTRDPALHTEHLQPLIRAAAAPDSSVAEHLLELCPERGRI